MDERRDGILIKILYTLYNMLYAIRENTPITSIPQGIEHIHLIRPISKKKIMGVLEKCTYLSRMTMSPSVEKRLTKKSIELIQKKGITIGRFNKPGRAIGIELKTIQEIADLRKDFLSVREISKKTGVPKSTVYYLIKKSKREKIRKGKNIIYV